MLPPPHYAEIYASLGRSARKQSPLMLTELSGIKHIVRLSGIHKDTGRRITTPVKAVTNTTGKPITFLTVDQCGRKLRTDADKMVPTGGFVHIIPEELVTAADLRRQREILGSCLDGFPEYLIGHEAHRRFTQWENAICRGRVIS
jgi:hypothetical protein